MEGIITDIPRLLPRIYGSDGKVLEQNKKYIGKPKLSYSQYTSWKDEKYKRDYILQYFLGLRQESGPYADFGSACGGYLENLSTDKKFLSPRDVDYLKQIERPDGAVYEREVVIDRGWYVIQGFIDREYHIPAGLVIEDFKTGSISSKSSFYGGKDYQQTTLYSYGMEQEGKKIAYSGVILLGRSGRPDAFHHNLKLTGEIVRIPTPYSIERAEKALADIDLVAEEISEAYYAFQVANGNLIVR